MNRTVENKREAVDQNPCIAQQCPCLEQCDPAQNVEADIEAWKPHSSGQ